MKKVSIMKLLVVALVTVQLSVFAAVGELAATVAEKQALSQIFNKAVTAADAARVIETQFAGQAQLLGGLNVLLKAKEAGLLNVDLASFEAYRAQNQLDATKTVNMLLELEGKEISLTALSATKTVQAQTARLNDQAQALAFTTPQAAKKEAVVGTDGADLLGSLDKDATKLDAAFRAFRPADADLRAQAKSLSYSSNDEDVVLRRAVGLYALGSKQACGTGVTIPNGEDCKAVVSQTVEFGWKNVLTHNRSKNLDLMAAARFGAIFHTGKSGVPADQQGRANLGLRNITRNMGDQAWVSNPINEDAILCVTGQRNEEFTSSYKLN